MGLGTRPFTHGLDDLGNGGFAWLQPDGSWGWSNAGMVVDGDQSLLVDTLFDKHLTAQMLSAMRAAAPAAAASVDMLVNTHANGDHCNGNELVAEEARIIASQACLAELASENPKSMQIMKDRAPQMGEVGEFFMHCFSAFDFDNLKPALPTETFSGELEIAVGNKRVLLKEVGPAHTKGDVLVFVPEDRLLFTGDILFIEGHPILWEGPVQNWIDACDFMLAADVENVVPGHGPITDKRGVRAVRDYLDYVRREARRRFDAGLSAEEAARDISLTDYDSWGDAERIAVNVAVLYREFAHDPEPPRVAELFALMARLHKERR